MNKITRGVFIASAVLFTHLASAASPTTLKEIVEKVVTSNPEVQANFHTYKAALQDQAAAKGGYWPHADIVSTFRNQERLTPKY